MRTVSRSLAIADFMERLGGASVAALVLDYDGTLAPFHANRLQAFPYAGVRALLAEIAGSGKTRLIFITGRPIAELQSLLGPIPKAEMWGAHGLQRLLPDGRQVEAGIDETTMQQISEAQEAVIAEGLLPHVEIKPGGVAVHWRGCTPREARRVEEAAREVWKRFLQAPQLRLLEFEQGVELRVAHPDKGDAVGSVIDEAGGEAEIAFLGDDIADEDGFRVLNARGLSVLVRTEYRETQAQAWLKPPEELIAFLEEWRKRTM